MTEKLSRRKLLGDAVKVSAGAAVGAGIVSQISSTETIGNAQESPALPWPYVELNPEAVAERAYAAFYKKGCMYGAFEGIIGELREKVGTPYTTFPALMMGYGAGGINGIWGTLCGTLNGAAAAIQLVSADPKPLIDELFFWASQTNLPDYRPKTPKFEIVKSVSGSPLCHVSVQRWCEVSKFKPTSPERADRCGWLTAAVAKRAVELLNQQSKKAFTPVLKSTSETQQCIACHGKDGAVGNVHHGSPMTCAQCHFSLGSKHP
jgi:hypothetical protein